MTDILGKSGSGRNLRSITTLCMVSALSLLAACDKAPEGQVVAVVNGDEITQQELNAELGNASGAEGDQIEGVRNAALESVINRRLLADVARDEGIDSTPEFIIRRRQMEEALLVQLLSQKIARELKQSSPEEIDRFTVENPQIFDQRTLFSVDQIRFPTPKRKDWLKALEGAETMSEVISTLNRLGIKFDRRNAQVDSATLNPDLFRQIRKVGTSEPIIIPNGPSVTVSQILSMESKALTGDDARPAASEGQRQQEIRKAIEGRLEKAKEAAGIDYQPGFGPQGEGDETSLEDVSNVPSQGGSPTP